MLRRRGLKPESTGKNVQRTVQSAEVFAKRRLRETSADWTVRCTSPRPHSTGEEPNSRKAAPEADEHWLNSLSPISYPWIRTKVRATVNDYKFTRCVEVGRSDLSRARNAQLAHSVIESRPVQAESRFFICCANFCAKKCASKGMSSARSRRGGSVIGKTFRR